MLIKDWLYNFFISVKGAVFQKKKKTIFKNLIFYSEKICWKEYIMGQTNLEKLFIQSLKNTKS